MVGKLKGALVSIGNAHGHLATHRVDWSRAGHHPFPTVSRGWIGAVEGTHLLHWNTSVSRHASHRVHWSRAVLHPLCRAVIERNMGAVVRAFVPVSNTVARHLAAHGVNGSRAAHHPSATIHRGSVGTVEGAFLSKSNAGFRHGTALEIDWSRAVHHPRSAIHDWVFRAGGRGHCQGRGEEAEEQDEVHHPPEVLSLPNWLRLR